MDMEAEFERLKQQLEEAQQRAEDAEQRAEDAEQQRQREQQRAEDAEQQRQREQQRAEDAEQQIRLTTLAEYIEACHELVFTKFAVEMDESLTSRGSTTNPKHKLCPTRLMLWEGFLEDQRTTFRTLYSAFPEQAGAFETRHFLHGLGNRISEKKVANEKDLEYFQHNSVEDPVRSIFKCLALEDAVKGEFDVGLGIVFENHPNAISDVAGEVVDRRAARLPQTPGQTQPDPGQLRPDQICVYRFDDGDMRGRSMAYVIEYKAPHKLTPPHLRLGLRPMDIYEEVVNRATKPTAEDAEALFQYHADKLVAAAVAQTFHYMIEGGLEYGILTTGEAIVFLKIDWADPTKLYYHLAEPVPEVQAHPNNFRYCTAVGQVLAFSLMALGPPGRRREREHSQDERVLAIRRLKTWKEDYEMILRAIPVSERKAPLSSPGYQPKTYSNIDRSPYLLRKKKSVTGYSDTNVATRSRSPESSDEESETRRMPGTPTPTQPNTRGRGSRGGERGLTKRPRGDGGRGAPSHSGGGRSRQFCTLKCLLGLLGRGFLDEKCPNVALHRGQSDGVHHPVDHTEWLRLLREQLRRTLDDGVVCIWKQGARGVLFQVTLLTHGYTFVAKGTVPEFVEDLEHETAVYRRLQPLQGVCVPVFLGTVDLGSLGRTYYYDFRVRVVYLMLLSWAGVSLGEAGTWEAMGNDPGRELVRSVRELHANGVAHTDVRPPNVLWCRETRRAMVIDFERAVLVDPPCPPMVQVVSKKRARVPRGLGIVKAVDQPSSRAEHRRLLSNDVSAARSIFPDVM